MQGVNTERGPRRSLRGSPAAAPRETADFPLRPGSRSPRPRHKPQPGDTAPVVTVEFFSATRRVVISLRDVRFSRAPAEKRHGMDVVAARYRVDFYVTIQRASADASPRSTKPWLIESVYVEDADLVQVVNWAFDHASDEYEFVLFFEQELDRDGDRLLVSTRLLGQEPTTDG